MRCLYRCNRNICFRQQLFIHIWRLMFRYLITSRRRDAFRQRVNLPIQRCRRIYHNPPAAGTAPTTPSSYTILPTLSGTCTVGFGGSATLRLPWLHTIPVVVGQLCLNCSMHLTPPRLKHSPLAINANPGSNSTNTLTIRPASSVVASITDHLQIQQLQNLMQLIALPSTVVTVAVQTGA